MELKELNTNKGKIYYVEFDSMYEYKNIELFCWRNLFPKISSHLKIQKIGEHNKFSLIITRRFSSGTLDLYVPRGYYYFPTCYFEKAENKISLGVCVETSNLLNSRTKKTRCYFIGFFG